MKLPTPLAPPGDILPLRRGWPQEKHVLKHLYRRAERWDFVVSGLPGHLRESALQAGCALMERVQRGLDHWESLSSNCAKLLRSDHEAYYRPAYMSSIHTSRELGRVGALNDQHDRYAYVGSNGVLVIATDGTDGRPARVVTAYRKRLTNCERRQPEEFVEATIRLWQDKTSLSATRLPQDEEEE